MFKPEPYVPTMGTLLKVLFALIVGAAGLFYIFNSHSAIKLERVEGASTNLTRRRYRRVGGMMMLLLAIAFFTGLSINPDLHPQSFVLIWVGVLFLLVGIIVMAMIDLRMTWKIRRRR